jgi:hypothetical protein
MPDSVSLFESQAKAISLSRFRQRSETRMRLGESKAEPFIRAEQDHCSGVDLFIRNKSFTIFSPLRIKS